MVSVQEYLVHLYISVVPFVLPASKYKHAYLHSSLSICLTSNDYPRATSTSHGKPVLLWIRSLKHTTHFVQHATFVPAFVWRKRHFRSHEVWPHPAQSWRLTESPTLLLQVSFCLIHTDDACFFSSMWPGVFFITLLQNSSVYFCLLSRSFSIYLT